MVHAAHQLREPRKLKKADVPASQPLARTASEMPSHYRSVWSIDHYRALKPVRGMAGDPPGDDTTPVVPHNTRFLLAGRLDEPEHVGGQEFQPIGRNPRRFVASIVAPLVRGPDSITGVRQMRELMPPPVPELRKAMKQKDEGTSCRAALYDMQTNPIRRNLVVFNGPTHTV